MFTVLVLVALITTVMATPLLALWDRLDGGVGRPRVAEAAGPPPLEEAGAAAADRSGA